MLSEWRRCTRAHNVSAAVWLHRLYDGAHDVRKPRADVQSLSLVALPFRMSALKMKVDMPTCGMSSDGRGSLEAQMPAKAHRCPSGLRLEHARQIDVPRCFI